MKKLLITLVLICLLVTPLIACGNFITIKGHVLRQTSPGVFMGVSRASIVSNGRYYGSTNYFGDYIMSVPNCGAQEFVVRRKGLIFQPLVVQFPIVLSDIDYLELDFIAIGQF